MAERSRRLTLHQGCGSPPAPCLPIHQNIRPCCEKYHPSLSSRQMPVSGYALRKYLFSTVFAEQSQKVWAYRKESMVMLWFQGWWVVSLTQLSSLSSNRENIQLCFFALFIGNLVYFCEFLNIYNPFIEDLLGGICLLWEVKEKPRK